jgi:BlaI family transcriptional regulator, penicillinase repressor
MESVPTAPGVRHSILDLAPLELDCMNVLWPLGEATVRDVQQALMHTRPRAYTTIMTILDRLAQKGVLMRRKAGRAWVYRPNLSASEARSHAVAQVVEGFFEGSAEALAVHLSGHGEPVATITQRMRPVRPAARQLEPAAHDRTQKTPESETPGTGTLDTSLL